MDGFSLLQLYLDVVFFTSPFQPNAQYIPQIPFGQIVFGPTTTTWPEAARRPTVSATRESVCLAAQFGGLLGTPLDLKMTKHGFARRINLALQVGNLSVQLRLFRDAPGLRGGIFRPAWQTVQLHLAPPVV